ncbi:MAG: cupin domain-containing protein [Gammaproteobacteria bacterium]|nr:cupin domain-containing protein [Gammaproteobacteria bacterium]
MPYVKPLHLDSTYLRLRNDASIEPLPVDDTFWERLTSGRYGSFHHEYLVTSYTFDADWTTWEMHPKGDEIVCLLSGSVTLLLDRNGEAGEVRLNVPGAYAVVPAGTWHTAKVEAPSRMLFVTAGEDTRTRPITEGDGRSGTEEPVR